MRVFDVMSKAIETVKPSVAASEAKTRMRHKKIHHLVVTSGSQIEGRIVGRRSRRDATSDSAGKVDGD